MKMQILILSIAMLATNPQSNFPSALPGKKTAQVTSAESTDFAFFRVHRQGKRGITATWGLTSTEGVTCFSVQRTYQDPNDPYSFWEEAGSVPCDPSRSFKFTDEDVFPGVIAYKIIAQMEDGSSVISEVADVRILVH